MKYLVKGQKNKGARGVLDMHPWRIL